MHNTLLIFFSFFTSELHLEVDYQTVYITLSMQTSLAVQTIKIIISSK